MLRILATWRSLYQLCRLPSAIERPVHLEDRAANIDGRKLSGRRLPQLSDLQLYLQKLSTAKELSSPRPLPQAHRKRKVLCSVPVGLSLHNLSCNKKVINPQFSGLLKGAA